jgi:hypothetical protein
MIITTYNNNHDETHNGGLLEALVGLTHWCKSPSRVLSKRHLWWCVVRVVFLR